MAKARDLSEHHQWHNVKLWQEDATEMRLPAPVDGVLFSLSYTMMPKPVTALEKAWEYLLPKRHVVIMDGKLAHGILARLSRPLVIFHPARPQGIPVEEAETTPPCGSLAREDPFYLLQVIGVMAGIDAHHIFDRFLPALGVHTVMFPLLRLE